MRISVFSGDIADAPVEAICTSTNPSLTLVMGTGAAVRQRGGFEILRACESMIDAERERFGRSWLPPGSAHVTTAGKLPARMVIHCVASDASHHTSAEIIRACTVNALAAADRAGIRSIGLPVFGTGHARFNFEKGLQIIAETLRDTTARFDEVVVAIPDDERAHDARELLARLLPQLTVELVATAAAGDETPSMWSSDDW